MALVLSRAVMKMIEVGIWRQTASSSWRSTGYRPLTTTTTTPEYLSSLWCLFEIVGFRKANPDGKLVFSPLFIERSVAICVILVWCIFLIIEVVVSQTPAALRQRYIVLLYLFMYFVPLVLVVHVLRGNFREKKQLIFDLKTFGLEKLTCAADFDSAFILSAVDEWYTSREAFAEFVRGPLHDELVSLLPSPALPCTYAALIVSHAVAWVVNFALSVYKGGAEFRTVSIFLVTYLALTLWYWSSFNGIFYFSDKTVRLKNGSLLMDWTKTLCVAGGVTLYNLVGFAWAQTVSRSAHLFHVGCYVLFSLLIPCFILGGFNACKWVKNWH